MAAQIIREEVVHRGWTTVRVVTIRTDGGDEFSREIEDHGSAAAVLPYDPERRMVTLVSQIRVPVLRAGGTGQLTEVPAGIVDPGEDASRTAVREAWEEAGLRLGALEPIGEVWPCASISTERLSLYLAAYSAADRSGEGGGVAHENEAIEVLEMPLDTVWGMLEGGRITDLKTLALLYALRFRHPELFAVIPGKA